MIEVGASMELCNLVREDVTVGDVIHSVAGCYPSEDGKSTEYHWNQVYNKILLDDESRYIRDGFSDICLILSCISAHINLENSNSIEIKKVFNNLVNVEAKK